MFSGIPRVTLLFFFNYNYESPKYKYNTFSTKKNTYLYFKE